MTTISVDASQTSRDVVACHKARHPDSQLVFRPEAGLGYLPAVYISPVRRAEIPHHGHSVDLGQLTVPTAYPAIIDSNIGFGTASQNHRMTIQNQLSVVIDRTQRDQSDVHTRRFVHVKNKAVRNWTKTHMPCIPQASLVPGDLKTASILVRCLDQRCDRPNEGGNPDETDTASRKASMQRGGMVVAGYPQTHATQIEPQIV